jgi:hypothetical protein
LLIGLNILEIQKIIFIGQDKTTKDMERDNTSQLEKDNNTLSWQKVLVQVQVKEEKHLKNQHDKYKNHQVKIYDHYNIKVKYTSLVKYFISIQSNKTHCSQNCLLFDSLII